jgi:predicted amidohydrolase
MQNISRVALVQMKSSEDKDKNLKLSISLIKEAAEKKANLICFPEFQMAFSPTNQSAKQLAKLAESINDGTFLSKLCTAAKQNKINVLATIYEKGNGGKNNNNNNRHQSYTNNRVYDTAVMINNKGTISSIYRKLHLYDALGFKESNRMMPGSIIEKPVKTSAGNIGLMICYDIRFPEMSRILTVNGADILAAPSAWVHGLMKEEHWQTMLKARAIENGLYMLAPDQVGNIYSGRSMIVDPFGVVMIDMGNREGIEVVEIDISQVQKVRESLPLLKNRRTDVYRDNISAFS